MDCREWEEGLDDLLAGRLSEAERLRAEEHAAGCSHCGELLAAAGMGLAGLSGPIPPPPPDLAEAVLARTSGSACGRARELLAARLDPEERRANDPAAFADAALLAGHLEHCPGCRAIETAFLWLPPTLRAMAEVEPDADFVYDVLRATSTTRLARRGTAGWRARLAERASGWWRRQVARPRFALEMAYAGTLALVVLFGTPVSPLRQVAPRALQVVEATPMGLAATVKDLVDLLPGRAGSLGRQAWAETGGRLEGKADEAAGRLSDRGRGAAGVGAELSRHGGELGRALLRHDFVQAAARWSEVRSDLKKLWAAWLGKAPKTAAQPMTMEPRRQS